MTVNNNIVTSSTVDGVDVSDMDADTVRESGDVTITGKYLDTILLNQINLMTS